ncbi:MAG: hypothetical protein Q6368_009100 [Candidatus Baldrarchaeota archaeon]
MRKIKAIGKVGLKGELYPSKEIREFVGLKPGEKVLYIATKEKLDVIPLRNLLKYYEEDSVRISLDEFEELTKEVLKG